MKRQITKFVATALLVFLPAGLNAQRLTLTSGSIFIGGDSFSRPDYQTILIFDVTGSAQNPVRTYRFGATQYYSVYLDHPIKPDGRYDYSLIMPYGPQSLFINGQNIYPVWYVESRWNLNASVITPIATVDSPVIATVESPFSMTGTTSTYGRYNLNLRTKGSGTVRIRFEKIGLNYFFLDGTYVFSEPGSDR